MRRFFVLSAVDLLPRFTTEATSVACVASIVRSRGRCRGASFIVLSAVALLPRFTTEATSVECVASIVRSGGVVVVRRLLCCWLLLCSPV